MGETVKEGMGPLKVPDVKDWKYEPGEKFMVYLSAGASLGLGMIMGYWTIDILGRHVGIYLMLDIVLLAFLWFVVLIFVLLWKDSVSTYRRRANSFTRFLSVPLVRIEEDVKAAFDSLGLEYSRDLVTTELEQLPIGGTVKIIQYQPTGADFRVTLEHYGPEKDDPDRDESLVVIGPITPEEQGRILRFIKALASTEEKAPPSLIVWDGRRTRGAGQREDDGDEEAS
jgi:hypothetical protein